MVTNQTQEALATEGRHPTFVVVLMMTLHPHAEQSSIGLHRGIYHVATTAITTLLRSLRVLAFPRSNCHHSTLSVATGATLSPLRGNHSSLSVATGATLSPLRGCVSPLGHTLRSPLLLRSRRPPSLLSLVLQRLAFSPLCSPGKCSFVTSCQGCIESAGAAPLSSSAQKLLRACVLEEDGETPLLRSLRKAPPTFRKSCSLRSLFRYVIPPTFRKSCSLRSLFRYVMAQRAEECQNPTLPHTLRDCALRYMIDPPMKTSIAQICMWVQGHHQDYDKRDVTPP